MARTMEQILRSGSEPRGAKTDAAKGEVATPQAQSQAPAQDQAPAAGEKPTAPELEPKAKEAKPTDKATAPDPHREPDEPDEPAEEMPVDVERLQTALRASRSDTRRERKHRRGVEIQMAEIRGQMQALMQRQAQPAGSEPAKAPPPPPPDLTPDNYYSGPEATKAYIDYQIAAAREEYQKRFQESQQRFIAVNIAAAKARHADYDEKVEITKGNVPPHIESQILNSIDPAETLYQYALSLELFKDAPNAEAIRAKIRKEVEAELAAKQQQASTPAQAPAVPKPTPPKSLAGVRGNGAGRPTTWAGPRSMEEILRR